MSASIFAGKEFTLYRSIGGTVATESSPIPELGPNDVPLRLTHSGIWQTDALYSNGGFLVAIGH